MKVGKKSFLFLLIWIFVLQFVNAGDTVIKISTVSNSTVIMEFLNPERGIELPIMFERKEVISGGSGEATVVFSNDAESFDLGIYLKENGVAVLHQIIDDITSGEPLHVVLIPGAFSYTKNYQEPAKNLSAESSEGLNKTAENVSQAVNQTDSLVENDSVNSPKSFFSFTGFATSDSDSYSKILIYGGIILFIIVIGVVIFIFLRKRKPDSFHGKGTDLKIIRPQQWTAEDELADAERKISEAQNEIRDIKTRKFGDSRNNPGQ